MDLNTNQQPLQATQTMDYEGFAKTLKYLLDAAWGDKWGSFSEEGPSQTDPKNVEYPIITHSLESFEPGYVGKSTREIKPRIRYVDSHGTNGNNPPATAIYGQVMQGILVFEVFEETNAKANALAKRLRSTIAIYTGYLKELGLKELIFQSQRMGPSVIRDNCVSRELRYLISFEELSEVPFDIFRVIEVVEKNLHRELGI